VPRATLVIPSIRDRTMKKVHLCSKHAPPDFMLGMVTSMDEFRVIVSHHCNNNNSSSVACSSSRKRRRKYFVLD
jgi:hypothetical protein